MTALIACPHCSVHCRVDEPRCPHCDTALRGRDGRIERTAAAVLLGLTVAGAAGAACSAPKYGGPPAPPPDASGLTTAAPPAADPPPTAAPTDSAHAVPGGMGGAGEPEPVAEYGVALPPED